MSQFAVYKDPATQLRTTYMSDFTRQPNQSGGIDLVATIFRPAGHDPSKNCYDCHKLPVLPIYPETEYKFDGSGKLVPKQGADVLIAPRSITISWRPTVHRILPLRICMTTGRRWDP